MKRSIGVKAYLKKDKLVIEPKLKNTKRRKQERQLDKTLEDTFPASDATAVY